MQIKVSDFAEALRRQELKGSRDDWGTDTERAAQVLEAFKKEFGDVVVEMVPVPA